jgi:ABC-type glycerol-3-phosphate transport system substrate-binding protein
MKKLISLLLIITMCLVSFSGCSKKTSEVDKKDNTASSSNETSNKEKSDEPVKLKLFLHSKDIQEESFTKDYIEEKTNTILEVTQVTTKELENKLNLILASGNRPDIMNFYTDAMEDKLVKGGALIPLNKYFDKYPELKAARTDREWEVMTHDDGNIYAIGISTANPLSIIGYRKDWLDKFGMDVPTTLDEYYEFAKAVALKDPDGNGKNDTYAFGGYSIVDRYMDHIFGAYGALPHYWMEKDGKLVNGSVLPEAKEALKFLKKMYDEKLIDPEFVTDDSKRWKTKVKAGTFGGGEMKIHLFDKNNHQNYYVPFKTKNPKGEFVFGPILKGGSDNPVGIRMASIKGWVRTGVSSETKDVDAALRLLTWTASEGNKFINYGLEGEHYKEEDGKLIRTIDNNKSSELDINKYNIAKKILFNHSSKELFDAFKHNESIALPNPADGIMVTEATKYDADLRDFTNRVFISMIVGAIDIETGFDSFVDEWNKRGGEALTNALNEKYQSR